MGNFPGIQYSQTVPGVVKQPRAQMDVSTGQEEIARGLMQFGGALAGIADTIHQQESAAEYSELKRKVDEKGFAAFNSVSGDEEADVMLWKNFQKDLDTLQSKRPNVQAALQSHINEVMPNWQDSFNKHSLGIRKKNAHDKFELEAGNALASGNLSEYYQQLNTRLALKDITQAEFDYLVKNAPNDSILQQMRVSLAEGQPNIALEKSKLLKNPTPDQLDYANKLKKMAEPELTKQQDSLRIEAANLWFDDQLTIDWLKARQNVMAADDYERFVTSLKTDKALRSNNIIKNRLSDMVYDVQRGTMSYEEFAKQAEQAATTPYIDNRPAITRNDYDGLLSDARREFASYQANIMKTSLGEIYNQTVTMSESALQAMATYLSAEQMTSAENRRQKEEDEYAEISKELRDWFVVHPKAGSEEFYKKKRELLALSKKHTADEIRAMRDSGQLRKYAQQRSGKVEPDFTWNVKGQKVLTQAGAQNLLIETGYDVERAKALAKERGLIDPEQ